MNELQLSQSIEDLLVARNLRHMQTAQAALAPGYYHRAASHLQGLTGTVIIGTGFPVTDTFETDGPVGAIALYNALKAYGAEPWLACAAPLSTALAGDYAVLPLATDGLLRARDEATQILQRLQPEAVVSIERPGLAEDGCYYNMRGEDISARCAYFDPFMTHATCPTIAIGDGGNEIGMGNIHEAIAGLDIRASVTGCDELLVADVSNWGAYGLIAFLDYWSGEDQLGSFSPTLALAYLSARGSVDGVTRENTMTEDGLEAVHGHEIIEALRQLIRS